MASVTKTVDAVAELTHTTGDVAWASLSNAATKDANAATCTMEQDAFSKYIVGTVNAGTFTIPEGARVDGIEVHYRAAADDGGDEVFDEEDCRIVVGDDITGLSLRNRGRDISPTASTFSVGGDGENWGMTLTPEMVNEAGFGFALRFERHGFSVKILSIYWIEIVVHYTAGQGTGYDSRADAGICCGTLPTSADLTTFRFRFPGLGTPKLALFAMAYDIKTVTGYDDMEGTDVFKDPNAYTVFSMTDGTRTYASRTWLNDTDEDVERGAKALSNHELVERSSDVQFASFGEDYVEITLGSFNSSSDRIMACVAFAGSDVQARVGNQDSLDGSSGEQADITTPAFKPSVVGLLSSLEEIGILTHDVYGGHGFGFALPDGENASVVVEQQVLEYSGGTTLPDITNFVRVSSEFAHENRNYGVDSDPKPHYEWTLGDFDANGFTITSGGDDATSPDPDDGSGWFALNVGSQTRVDAGVFCFPNQTGRRGLQFLKPMRLVPRFALLVSTLAPTRDVDHEDVGDADALMLTFMREGIAVTVGMTAANGTLITSHNWTHRNAIFLPKGDESTAAQAGRPTFGPGRIEADFSTAGVRHCGVYFALGDRLPAGSIRRRAFRARPARAT